jgi:hypothetical protein
MLCGENWCDLNAEMIPLCKLNFSTEGEQSLVLLIQRGGHCLDLFELEPSRIRTTHGSPRLHKASSKLHLVSWNHDLVHRDRQKSGPSLPTEAARSARRGRDPKERLALLEKTPSGRMKSVILNLFMIIDRSFGSHAMMCK